MDVKNCLFHLKILVKNIVGSDNPELMAKLKIFKDDCFFSSTCTQLYPQIHNKFSIKRILTLIHNMHQMPVNPMNFVETQTHAEDSKARGEYTVV